MTNLLHNKRLIWALFIIIAVSILLTYVMTSLNSAEGNLLMPLDDVYIHFQYARQMALGNPYQYNLIDPPTSGATSLIYPYLLTTGYWMGFQGLWLGLWAMILGTVALVVSQWTVYRLCKTLDTPQWLSLLTAVTFALTGSIAWHFMSGMETGIVITLTLLTLLVVIEKRLFPFLIVSTLLTLTRPEGGLVAAIGAGTLFLRLWQDYSPTDKSPEKRHYLLLLALPILAFGAQPALNWLITGTTVATGAQAKSILSNASGDYPLIISRIWDNVSRMWIEFITGYDAREGRGWYLPIFTGLTGLFAIPLLLLKKNYRLIGLMLLGWLLITTAAISTLDNAFWHFKRYQMPMLALFFPLSAWVVAEGLRRFPKMRYIVYTFDGIVIPIFVIFLFAQFQQYHARNVEYVYQQPYQMGIWLRDNTSEDALIAVHDVGLMRYIGERSTLDIVGLTTPSAASYWRSGPGAVAEFLINQQPDYIANYGDGHGYGLAFLADTALYENQLAQFTIENWQPHLNVALATDSQAIYRPDWQMITPNSATETCAQSAYLTDASSIITTIDIADLISEQAFDYQWQSENLIGFATETRQFDNRVESYRLINQSETFIIDVPVTEQTSLLLTTVHASTAGTIDIYLNDTFVDTKWIPAIAGQLVTIATQIPAEFQQDNVQVRIEPSIENGFYMPACHTTAITEIDTSTESQVATYQDGEIILSDVTISQTETQLDIDLTWLANNPTGDYRLFVHLYDDPNQPPVSQWDGYYSNLLVGNWLQGTVPSDNSIQLSLADLETGTYQLAIGFYNPNNPTDRLIPQSNLYDVTQDGRLWFDEIEVE